jgi:hypothetical protein
MRDIVEPFAGMLRLTAHLQLRGDLSPRPGQFRRTAAGWCSGRNVGNYLAAVGSLYVVTVKGSPGGGRLQRGL